MKKRSAEFFRKRKFYLALPLLALPFITLAFWSLGGGQKNNESFKKTTVGLNLQLPDAKLKDEKNLDKLSFYDQADKDSLKHIESIKNDPNYHHAQDSGLNVLQLMSKQDNSRVNSEYKNMIQSPFSNAGSMEANEQKIYKKINELNKQINTPHESKSISQNNSESANYNLNQELPNQVDKLQNMMMVMNDKPENDPEMEQLGGMLDKILDIQHPERIKDKIKEKSMKNKQQVFTVQPFFKEDNITLMQSGRKNYDTIIKKKIIRNSFYDLKNSSDSNEVEEHAIEAVVHETQIVTSGSTVKLRLTDNIYINGILIAKGNFIYGTASLENERLSININAIRYKNNLLPVALQVYDLDGIAGIHVPGSVNRDVSKQSAEQSLQNLELTTLDPSLAVQAANTGIAAAKTLLTKKVKLVKVILKAGYRVLLNDTNKRNN